MKQLVPQSVGDAQLVSTNVVETVPEFDIDETVAKGVLRRDEATHTLYESQVDGNTGHALTEGGYWVKYGPTNPRAMFDQKVGTITSNAETIDFTVTSTGRITGLAFFRLNAATIRVIVTDAIDGVVYDETFSMVSQENVDDIYDYFFAPLLRRSNFSIENLPPYTGAEVRVIISQPGGTAECGNAVPGYWEDLGGTEWGTEYGTIDFSSPKADQFNNIDLKKGTNRPTITASAEIELGLIDEAKRVLDDALGELRVWKVDDLSSGLLYGFARSSRIRKNQAFGILSADLESVG